MWYHESAMFPQERQSAYYPCLVIDCNIQTSGLGPQATKKRFSIYLQQVESWKLWSRSWPTLGGGEGYEPSFLGSLGEDEGHLNGLVISALKHLHTTALMEPS